MKALYLEGKQLEALISKAQQADNLVKALRNIEAHAKHGKTHGVPHMVIEALGEKATKALTGMRQPKLTSWVKKQCSKVAN